MRKFDEKNIERRVKFNEAKKEYTIKTNKQTKVHNGIIVKSKNEEENFVCTIIFFISYWNCVSISIVDTYIYIYIYIYRHI